jgi:protein TonB
MKRFLTLLMLFLIPIACAAESQPIEPRVKPAYPAKAEKKGYRVRLKRNLTLMRMGG